MVWVTFTSPMRCDAILNNMGFLLNTMGKREEALPYYRKALEGCHRVLGDDHPNTLVLIGNIGQLLEAMGEHDEAMPYTHQALEGCRRVLGNDHSRTLLVINNMGVLLDAMGNSEETLGNCGVRAMVPQMAATQSSREELGTP